MPTERYQRQNVQKNHQKNFFSPIQKLRQFTIYGILIFIGLSIGSCLLLRYLPAPTSAFMLYRHFEDLTNHLTYRKIEQHWVNASKISPNAFIAVIAAEDQRFFDHFGFDFEEIGDALGDYAEGRSLRGASTLTQQVAKNLFLTPSRSFIRKILEAWFTILIELFWSKERILVMYLNIAEFGEHIFGIEAASRHYFGAPAKQLSHYQAALLAATLPNPVLLKARQPSQYLLKRQRWISKQMQNIQIPQIN
jgi:monofunctional glycosyltransferase